MVHGVCNGDCLSSTVPAVMSKVTPCVHSFETMGSAGPECYEAVEIALNSSCVDRTALQSLMQSVSPMLDLTSLTTVLHEYEGCARMQAAYQADVASCVMAMQSMDGAVQCPAQCVSAIGSLETVAGCTASVQAKVTALMMGDESSVPSGPALPAPMTAKFNEVKSMVHGVCNGDCLSSTVPAVMSKVTPCVHSFETMGSAGPECYEAVEIALNSSCVDRTALQSLMQSVSPMLDLTSLTTVLHEYAGCARMQAAYQA